MTEDNEAPETEAADDAAEGDAPEPELVAPKERAERDVAPDTPPEDDGFRPPKRVVWGIAIALALQVMIPLTYYARADRYDERFAWRMFSGVRMQRCQTAVFEERATGRERLDLTKLVHVAWSGLFSRNRRAAIQGFLEARCDLDGVTRVELMNTCQSASGDERHPDQLYRLECGGEIEWPSAEGEQ